MKNEIRNINAEIRTTESSRMVEGYGIVFNSLSEDLGFREIIDPEAINNEILNNSDILCLLNHDVTRGVLARSNHGKGSLKLTIDEKGLKYAFEAPKTALGDELLEGIKRGDIYQSSFAFRVAEDEWKTENDTYIRVIKKFDKLTDISPVYQAAYSATSVDTRGLDQLKAEQRKIELKEYFSNLREEIEK